VPAHKHIISSSFVGRARVAKLADMKTIAASTILMSRADPEEREPGFAPSSTGVSVRDVPVIVGSNLRRLRKAHGLSLERLAEISGVSRAMLGQIETAKSVPTVSLLWRVADALAVPVATLVSPESEPPVMVLSRNGASVLVGSEGRFSSRSLSPGSRQRRTGFFELLVAAGHRESIPAAPVGTRHNLVVAHGRLTILFSDDEPVILEEGDAIAFEASTPYALENPAQGLTTAYLVVQPPAA
jgi:transcriptional regulator with XRE-family HTH domain